MYRMAHQASINCRPAGVLFVMRARELSHIEQAVCQRAATTGQVQMRIDGEERTRDLCALDAKMRSAFHCTQIFTILI